MRLMTEFERWDKSAIRDGVCEESRRKSWLAALKWALKDVTNWQCYAITKDHIKQEIENIETNEKEKK